MNAPSTFAMKFACSFNCLAILLHHENGKGIYISLDSIRINGINSNGRRIFKYNFFSLNDLYAKKGFN